MPKPKDAKVWNEDLAAALEARYHQGLREGKRDALSWRKGLDKIQAVRKDIYLFRTGSIANMPRGLTKRVERLCEDVIRGVKNVYPDGHVPTNGAGGGNNENPFLTCSYTKSIKIRSGAFAILMALYYSKTDVLRKSQICKEAQKFCDVQMDTNFLAGREWAGWSGSATLKTRHFICERGFTKFTSNGFRSSPHEYSLTNDGRLFVEALFAIRPEALEAAQQAAKASPTSGGQSIFASAPVQTRLPVPLLPNSANKSADRVELEDWIATANVGDSKEFNVGKDRRHYLHNLCDALQAERPGLLLTHSSSGTSSARTLSIQLVSKPNPGTVESLGGMDTTARKPPPPLKSARENAGLAAIKREEASKEEIDLKKAIAESLKSVESKSTPMRKPNPKKILFDSDPKPSMHVSYDDDHHQLNLAIQASLEESARKGVKRNIFSIESSDDEENDLIRLRAASRKRRRTNATTNANDVDGSKKPAAKDTYCIDPLLSNRNSSARTSVSTQICCIDIDSDGSDDDAPKTQFIAGERRTKGYVSTTESKKPRTITSEELGASGSKIDLCESTDDEIGNQEVIEIKESQEDAIDLSYSQQEVDAVNDDVVCVVGIPPVASPTACQKKDSVLTILIDSRERSRNATPRELRIELKRHLTSGPISVLWPSALPPANVLEEQLSWGDFQYRVESSKDDDSSMERLGIAVERKRVNDLVQRSLDGDHLTQVFRMQQNCSLSILLIENDSRIASSFTPYNLHQRDDFDPFDSAITCENDIFRMFGRLVVCSSSKDRGRINFWQTRDDQASLRAIGALGLMAMFAPSRLTKERRAIDGSSDDGGAQGLTDQLVQGGIPWRIAKRVSIAIGSRRGLKAHYENCCNESAKSNLLNYMIETGNSDDAGDLHSSPNGWSDAIFRIVTSPKRSGLLSGQASLLLHKNLVPDHGIYLSTLYRGHSHQQTLKRVLEASPTIPTTIPTKRNVSIHLTHEQAAQYFCSSSMSEEEAFYKLSIVSKNESRDVYSDGIYMQTICDSLASEALLIFEVEGSDIVAMIHDRWNADNQRERRKGSCDVAKDVARRIDSTYSGNGRASKTGTKRILLLCGMQPALDANAKQPGYAMETRTLVDMVFAELLLSYNIVIIQALRKKTEDRINVMQQLALACYHHGLCCVSVHGQMHHIAL